MRQPDQPHRLVFDPLECGDAVQVLPGVGGHRHFPRHTYRKDIECQRDPVLIAMVIDQDDLSFMTPDSCIAGMGLAARFVGFPRPERPGDGPVGAKRPLT